MTAQQAASTNTSATSPNEFLVQGLAQTGQLACLKRIATKYGFTVTSRWGSTVESLKMTLDNPSSSNPNATYGNLKRIAINIITSCNNTYSIDKIANGGDVKKLATIANFSNFSQHFAAVFPAKLDEDTGLPSVSGHYITAIEDMGNGIAIIFSYVLLRKISGSKKMKSNMYPTQFFNTVFIPNDLSRIEYRVDRAVGKRFIDKAMAELRDNFIGLLRELKITLNLKSVNFYEAIEDIYNDKGYGRVVQADFMDITDGDDAQLRCRTNPTYDARECEVNKKNNKKTGVSKYSVCGVAVRFDYNKKGDVYHNEIGFEPNKADWLNKKFCGSFYFEQPSDDVTHYGVINDILRRAKN
ncbi:TPA: hypothetical protein ACXIY6_000135 [Serratia marcescens]